MYVYAFRRTILALHPLCILCIYLYLYAYRIVGGDNTSRVRGRGRGGPAGDLVAGGSQRRRIGPGGATQVS